MSYCPEHLKYTKDHEWVEKTGDRRVRVGITDFAQKQLGDIVFVDVPSVNRAVDAGEPLGIVESVKSVSDLYAPVPGRVTAKNPDLDSDPELVNTDSYGDGWIAEIEIAGTGALDGLLDAAQYQEFLAAE
ncbi:glycine cleavage system protein GcvH [Streptomyces sp. NPDC020472]|uniref:glycine cleavage system protein GcvH n=1 Tax=Streptomyces sp. NPDC020472 TaxID=3365075 RepID=UPI00378D3CC4